MAKKLETQFKDWLIEQEPKLDKNYISRHGGERPFHLRFRSGCGIDTVDEFKTLFVDHKLIVENCDDFTGSPDYKGQGFRVDWRGHKVGVILAVQRAGRVKRKAYAPKNLGLAGYRAETPAQFKQDIITGLIQAEPDAEFRNCLISMLDNIDSNTPIVTHANLKVNTNRITSDFGEVLAAYMSACRGNVIEFPVNSNNNIADYIENDKPVSAKGRAAGNKLNLSDYKNVIPKNSNVGKFLLSLAEHNKNDFFKYGAKVCKQARLLAEWVGGTDEADIVKYVKSISYDEFYNKIKADPQFEMLGIPLASKDARPRELWAQGSTEPFYFTLNTIIHRLWGIRDTATISQVIKKFLTEVKFLHIDIENQAITSQEIPSTNIETWGTEYHSRATKAWHNWMGVQGIVA